jgi:hypothetical protein
MRKNGFTDEDINLMEDREKLTLIGFIENEKEKNKIELKLMLYDVIRISAQAACDKELNKAWEKAYKKGEEYYKQLLGIDTEKEKKKISDDKFKYKGGRKKIYKI